MTTDKQSLNTTPLAAGDLMQLAPESATVTVRGQQLTVHGVSAADAARLVARFPDFQTVIAGRGMVGASPMAFVAAMPEIVAAMVAAGCGYPDNADAEAKAASLSLNDQLALFGAILQLTAPDGLPTFLEKVAALTEAVGVRKPAKLPNRAQRRANATSKRLN